MIYPFLLLGLLGLTPLTLLATDLDKERRWEQQIVDALLDGEAIHLNDGRGEFLAIETPPQDDSTERVAIIMHGTGVHPDWPTVVQPLRTGLPQQGWRTLSIQMPILANEAQHEDYAAIYDWVPGRLDAAIDHARTEGAKTLVLIAHSQGSTMSAYYLANGGKAVDGFVAIGMGPGFTHGPMDNLRHLGKLELPMLDLYGSEDLPEVIESAAARKTASSRTGRDYLQVKVDGADHFFDGEEGLLLEQVSDWLERFPATQTTE